MKGVGTGGRESGAAYLWHVVVSPLPLLLLQLDGDAPHRASLDALHQMGHKPANTTVNIALDSQAGY